MFKQNQICSCFFDFRKAFVVFAIVIPWEHCFDILQKDHDLSSKTIPKTVPYSSSILIEKWHEDEMSQGPCDTNPISHPVAWCLPRCVSRRCGTSWSTYWRWWTGRSRARTSLLWISGLTARTAQSCGQGGRIKPHHKLTIIGYEKYVPSKLKLIMCLP